MTFDAYATYVRLLDSLHLEMSRGNPDEDVVEDFAESLDAVWPDLSVAEADLARRCDEELSSKHPDEFHDVMVRYLAAGRPRVARVA